MTKNNKIKKTKIKNNEKPEGRIAAIILLIIMVLSIAGFAVLTGGPQTSSSSSTSSSQSEVPMGLIFQNSQTGDAILGTIRNNERFIFPDTTGYESDLQMLDLAENIKSKEIIEIYVDQNFKSSESVFLIEKALKGIKKIYTTSQSPICTKNKLILTNNESSYIGCAVFTAAKNDEYRRSDILVYHLVK